MEGKSEFVSFYHLKIFFHWVYFLSLFWTLMSLLFNFVQKLSMNACNCPFDPCVHFGQTFYIIPIPICTGLFCRHQLLLWMPHHETKSVRFKCMVAERFFVISDNLVWSCLPFKQNFPLLHAWLLSMVGQDEYLMLVISDSILLNIWR